MTFCVRLVLTVIAAAVVICSNTQAAAQIRDRAVVSLTFDDVLETSATTTVDTAKSGKGADAVSLAGQPSRTASAFVAGSHGYSLLVDPARQQQIVVASSDDTSRPDAVTVSGLFASLQPPETAAYQGLYAKRKGGQGDNSNYGINFNPSTDVLQVYVNDGTGYKVANYSVKATIAFRRRVHLTLCLDNGDAPAADADADPDDIRVRLFVNGQPVTPTGAPGGLVDGTMAWLQDVTLAKCVSETPLTIGSSFKDGELTRLICDDIHLFAESLSDDDVKALYAEVTGVSAAEIAAEQGGTASAAPAQPQIVRVTPHSAEINRTTRLTIAGQNLLNARLHADVLGLSINPADGGTAGQAVFDIAVGPTVVPGRYLLRCVTAAGVSNPLVIAIDRLSTQIDGAFTEAGPATVLPAAVGGLISGTEQKRLWFKGTANQRVVAEVEARRVGSKLDPVVEIRSQAGTPLAVQWQQSDLSGDARTAATLPADGIYFAEVHDLQFQAPGSSPWRLIVGDLPPSSVVFPTLFTSTGSTLRVLGRESVSEPVSVAGTNGRLVVESGSPLLPLPPLRTVSGVQINEPVDGVFPATAIDATFTANPFSPLFINGRIVVAKEQDSVLLTVTPGQTLYFAAAARSIQSPLRPHLALFNGDALVAQNDGETGAKDPAFNFAVPEGVTQLRVQIRDINGKASPAAAYRLEIGRTDRVAFVLAAEDSVQLPANGSVPLELTVVRQSPHFRYTGPIHLSVAGAPGISVVPAMLPSSEQTTDQRHIVMLTRSEVVSAESVGSGQSLILEGRTEGPEPVFSTIAILEIDAIPDVLTLPETTIVAGSTEAILATVLLDAAPPVLLRGIATVLPVRVLSLVDRSVPFVRFEMMTTEPTRWDDPNKPDSPLKAKVRLAEFQFGPVSQATFPLALRVPLDTPASTLDAVISAEFVSQPLAAASGSKSWTAPITLFVDQAVTMTISAEPFKGTKAALANVTGSIQRHPLFTEPVMIVLEGLPTGYTAAPVTVAAEQSDFGIAVMIPEAAAAGEVPNLSVRVQQVDGNAISNPAVVRLMIE